MFKESEEVQYDGIFFLKLSGNSWIDPLKLYDWVPKCLLGAQAQKLNLISTRPKLCMDMDKSKVAFVFFT